MKKLLLLGMLSVTALAGLTGCSLFETVKGLSAGQPVALADISELRPGSVYVWHNDKVKDIRQDIRETPEQNVFFRCPTGDINFAGKETEELTDHPRSIWINEEDDQNIPTLKKGDRLLYVSEKDVPEKIILERFADYGYTIGVSNLIGDPGEHYYILYADAKEDDYKYSVDMESDAAKIVQFDLITRLYLDKVGDINVRNDTVSAGGTVTGLEKGKEYVCEFYTGTFYQDFLLRADIHSFGSMERFVSYDFEFLHSNCIAIEIPEYCKSGYYFVNGAGLFRYVSEQDESVYNGEAYDENIDWNEPIVLYDELGIVTYDPSNQTEEIQQEENRESEEKDEFLPEGDNDVREEER